MHTYRLGAEGLVAAEQAADSLTASSLALPPGVYTTLRTYHRHRVLRLEEHLARLESSARLMGHAVSLDRARVRAALREALARGGYAESRVRLTAAFAQGARPAELYIALEPLATPGAALYLDGVRAASVHVTRLRPRAKSTEFIAVSSELYARKPPGVYELLMATEDGAILEGLTSNFFGLRAGTLYTAEAGVLEGVTRSIVIEAAQGLGYSLRREPVMLSAIGALDEAFITSSSREVLPVVTIDAQRIGSGRPGPVTRALLADYRARVERELEVL